MKFFSRSRPWNLVEAYLVTLVTVLMVQTIEGQRGEPTITYPSTTTSKYGCLNPWLNLEDCERWSKAGECFKNYNWMRDNCFRSCGYCSDFARCEDAEDDEKCRQWAGDDECSENESWMRENCFKSCGYCKELTPEPTESTLRIYNVTNATTTDSAGSRSSADPLWFFTTVGFVLAFIYDRRRH